VLTDIEVRYEGFEAVDVQPRSLPDVFADRPIELIGKWKGEAKGRIVVSGISGEGKYEAVFDVGEEAGKGTENEALRVLWAREKVRTLAENMAVAGGRRGGGQDDEKRREITALGLTYALLTEFTSFVGVDETPREVKEKLRKVKQPQPLPKGVSETALGSGQVKVGVSGGGGGAPAVPRPSREPWACWRWWWRGCCCTGIGAGSEEQNPPNR
jgi:Ca-activated chloride channel family protein